MKAFKRFSPTLGLLILVSTLWVRSAESSPSPQDPPACDTMAWAARQAARNEALETFWLKVGNFANEPGDDLLSKVQKAWIELLEENALAEEQFLARLEVCEALGHGAYDPQVDFRDFTPDVTNLYCPMIPSRTFVYEKQTEEGVESMEVTVLDSTVEISGVACREVNVKEIVGGAVQEDALEYYSQHSNGTVWSMGKVNRCYEDGFLDNMDGSWRSGHDGAKPGVMMLAEPASDDIYRQEFFLGEAEDVGRVLSLDAKVTVPAGEFANCLEIEEFSPLEPGARQRKYFAAGVGLVLEIDLDTGERLELVSIID